MTPPTRSSVVVAAGSALLMITLAFANHTLNGDQQNSVVLAAFGMLFAAFVAALVPLSVRLVLRAQARVGNAEQPLVRWLVRHESGVVHAVWAVFALGLLTALSYLLLYVM